jgi:hypothetical protein
MLATTFGGAFAAQTADSNASSTQNTFAQGNNGAFVPAGINSSFFHLHRLDKSQVRGEPIRFYRAPVLIEVHPNALNLNNQGNNQAASNQQGQSAQSGQSQTGQEGQTTQGSQSQVSTTIPSTFTYVYFNLNQREARMWERGELSIYFKDRQNQDWQVCPAVMVTLNNNTQSGQGEQNAQGNQGSQVNQQGNNQDIKGPVARVACAARQLTIYGLGSPRNPDSNNNAQQQSGSDSGSSQNP